MDIVCLGELIIDLLPVGRSENGFLMYEANPGGAPANVAAAVASYGGKSALIAKVGKDALGRQLSSVLRERNVEVSGIVSDAVLETAMAMVTLDEQGDRSFRLLGENPADLGLQEQDLNKELLCNCKIFHFGARSLSAKSSKQATCTAVMLARAAGAKIAFDPNVRPNLWINDEESRADCKTGIALADYIKLSMEELEFIFQTKNIAQGLQMLEQCGKKCIVTDGANGIYTRINGELQHVPAYTVTAVDTTGAGDAFWGAWLYASLMPGVTPMRQLYLASAAGALTTQKKGAILALPGWKEVEAVANNEVFCAKPLFCSV